jgi:zinc transport system ATP-binding protein
VTRNDAPDSDPTPAIEIRDLWLSLGGVPILQDIHLTVEQRAFLGIIGPNGGGKTTLLRVLLGLLQPDRGTVRILGQPPHSRRGEVAYVPQFSRFDPAFPIRVLDVVLMGRLGRGKLLRPYGKADLDRALRALEEVDSAELAGQQVDGLSGGQLQRVLIARALAMDSRVLLLDEPVASLDARVGGRLYELLARLSGARTVVLVDHDVGVMSRYVRSIACLNRRLHYHESSQLTREMLEETYGYPVGVLSHDHDPELPPARERS